MVRVHDMDTEFDLKLLQSSYRDVVAFMEVRTHADYPVNQYERAVQPGAVAPFSWPFISFETLHDSALFVVDFSDLDPKRSR